MELRTLGTLALGTTTFHRHKPLLLLAYLALEGSQERAHIARTFWPEAAQPSQRLRSTLELLRSAAPGAAERVGSKVMTALRCDAVDLLSALEDGNPERCVALYEGAFLDGLAAGRLGLELEEWVFATRERLAEYVRHALLRLSDISRAEPKRAAHYARQAYLLAGAQTPSTGQLRHIWEALQAAGDPLAVEVRRTAEAENVNLITVSPSDPIRTIEVAEGATMRHNLATPLTALLGRSALLADLERRLASPDVRLLTLTGMGGVGKTRLAVELAWQQRPFYNAVYFVPLAASHEPDEVLSIVARVLDLNLVVGQPLRDVLIAKLQGEDVLLVLDNFEQVLGAATEVADLLTHCRHLRVIVTSRSALRLRGENEVVVLPLPTPAAHDGSGNEIRAQAYASVALFCARAAEAGGRKAFTEGELVTIGDLCRRIDGLPLAIELAASRTKLLSPAEILERLDQSLDLLAQRALDLPERHRSLRGTLAWSYELLTEDEKRLFRYLGVAPDGCDLTLAKALWKGAPTAPGSYGSDETQVLTLLGSLLDKNLIGRVAGNQGEFRVTMLETVRRFAAEALAADPVELRSNLKRMFNHLCDRLSSLRERSYVADTEVIAEVAGELGNIRAAWLWAMAEGHKANIVQVLMFNFFAVAGRYRDGIRLFTEAIRFLGKSGDAETRGRLYGSLAWFYYRLGDTEKAKDAAEKSVIALRQLENPEVLGVALETYGGILYGTGNYAGAGVAYTEAYGLFKAADCASEHLSVLDALGLVASAKGDYLKALELFGRVRQLAQHQNRTWMETGTLAYIGEVHRLRGDLEASRVTLEEAYVRSQATAETYFQLVATYQLSLTTLASSDVTRAEALLSETLQAARAGQVSEFVARAHLGLARTAAIHGAVGHVSRHLLEALLAVKDTGLRPVVLSCILTVAELGSFVGLEEQARALRHAVCGDPTARAHERHQAAALTSEIDGASPISSGTVDLLPALIEQVVKHLAQTHADNPVLHGDL